MIVVVIGLYLTIRVFYDQRLMKNKDDFQCVGCDDEDS
jgi:hypothetical protein